jgi:hypothetical protein
MEDDQREIVNEMSTRLLLECDGNFLNGTPNTHTVWYPGINYYGPECHWDLTP